MISPSHFHTPPMEAANNSSSIPFFPFLILLLIGFLILLIIIFRDLLQFLSSVRRYVSGNGGSALQQQSNEAGLYPTIIASFPMFYYSEVRRFMEGRNGGECAVCLLEFAAGDVIRLLMVCRHAFHPGCIDLWFVSHKTCPICRSNLEEALDKAAMMAMGVVVASGRDEDNHVISIKGIGESAEGEEREGMENTIAMEGGEVEQNFGMSITVYGEN